MTTDRKEQGFAVWGQHTHSNDTPRQPWQDDCLAIAEAMAAQGAREVSSAKGEQLLPYQRVFLRVIPIDGQQKASPRIPATVVRHGEKEVAFYVDEYMRGSDES